jgi:hypothetical protein
MVLNACDSNLGHLKEGEKSNDGIANPSFQKKNIYNLFSLNLPREISNYGFHK